MVAKKINPVCLEIDALPTIHEFTLVPRAFYKSVLHNGKPHLLAILILSDIIFWYKPNVYKSHAKNEYRYEQKFKADKLQRSYDYYVEMFNHTKRQVKQATDILVKLNFITKEFRTIEFRSGIPHPNTLFIEPVVATIRKAVTEYVEHEHYYTSETYIAKFLQEDTLNTDPNKIWEQINWQTDTKKIATHIRKMKYNTFLSTVYWKTISFHVMQTNQFLCSKCKTRDNLVTHHLTYEHHGYEHLHWETDLVCLCDSCHKKIHNITTN